MKKLLILLVMLTSCTHYKYNKSEPFAVQNRIGKYPTKKNIPVKQKKSWTFKNYGHQGR